MNIFATRLKELRDEKWIGQVELAQNLKVSKGIISLWENGLRETSMHCLIAIADFFDCGIDFLVGRTD